MVQGMNTVYLLWHTNPLNDDEKLIGVYSSREGAEKAVQRVKDQPGFRDSPEGFEIFDCTLDRDGWREGFISTEEALDTSDKI